MSKFLSNKKQNILNIVTEGVVQQKKQQYICRLFSFCQGLMDYMLENSYLIEQCFFRYES